MTVTVVEAPALVAGDTVRVSDVASDPQGYSSGSLRGKLGRLDFYDTYSGWYVRPLPSTDDGVTRSAYVAPEFLTKVMEDNTLTEEVAALKTKLAAAESAAASARNARSAFQDQVQEAIRDAYDDDTDLLDPLNAILSTLGLDPIEREFEVTVRFNGSYTTTVTARDEDEARESIDKDEIAEYLVNNSITYAIDDFETEV